MGQQKGFTTWAPKQDSGVWAQTTWSSGPAHMGQKYDSAKQHAEGQQIPCKPNCICKLNGLKLPTNVQRKKSQQYDANEFQQHEAKKISSIRPYNFKKKYSALQAQKIDSAS